MKYKFTTSKISVSGDVITPTQCYLRLRDLFPGSLLLESSDHQSSKKSVSLVCIDPLAEIKVEDGQVVCAYPDKSMEEGCISSSKTFPEFFNDFTDRFQFEGSSGKDWVGFFGYTTYDAVTYFEDIQLRSRPPSEHKIPDIWYRFFKNTLVFDHFQNQIHLFENIFHTSDAGRTEKIMKIIHSGFSVNSYPFSLWDREVSNVTDEEFMSNVSKAREACALGEVFQMVVSRQYRQKFFGDDFKVYRTLRSINPSPYLFYFDFGDFKILGSSPEAQFVAESGQAYIDPIAGTFRRTGNDLDDMKAAERLASDPKEVAEHTMLVDLARNDLSIYCDRVFVEKFKEVQYFSHVLHLVSRVCGTLPAHVTAFDVFAKTFPAGTLSGAPKCRAMEWIDRLENQRRGFYGGTIGFIGLGGQVNQAITIRTFLSKDNTLFWQAGAGVVFESQEQNELREVENKLAALKQALALASETGEIII